MKSELLLPVGNLNMCLAAIHHGADAIYVGVPFFNARGRTTDMSIPELKEMIDLCHLYGVRVNLAFNVVIFQNEFPKVVELNIGHFLVGEAVFHGVPHVIGCMKDAMMRGRAHAPSHP